eukprot:g47288.t1
MNKKFGSVSAVAKVIKEASSTSIKLLRGAVTKMIHGIMISANRMHSKGFGGTVVACVELTVVMLGVAFELSTTVEDALSASLQSDQEAVVAEAIKAHEEQDS